MYNNLEKEAFTKILSIYDIYVSIIFVVMFVV